ncbi:MAG: hypothetical protein HY259_14350 [Chloroflexi bacterium]|nr:hypothetical protein [Chloroflexota bacterium]
MRAFEVGGTIDEHQQLHLDSPLPVTGPSRVRVIVLVPDDDEPNEREWLHGAMTNPAFDFLNDPEEDIYSLADGKPFRDQA